MADRLFEEPWPKLVWSQRNLDHCREKGFRNVTAIGSPYLYLQASQPVDPGESRGPRSLLVYPFHGWEKGRAGGDIEAYADAIGELEREHGFGPITVCLYWLEYEEAAIRGLFEGRGWTVTTNGHRDGNPSFLHRQRASLLQHAYVTSNRVCTAAFYALAMGKKFFLYGPVVGLSASDDPHGEEFGRWQKREFPELTWESFEDESHRDTGLRELGADFVLSPDDLRGLLGWSLAGALRLAGRRAARECWKVGPLRRLMAASPRP
jgi:hypothetical protein